MHVISRKRTGDISILFAKNLPKLCVTLLNRALITYDIFIHEGNYLGRKNCYSPESIYLEVDPCRNKGLPKSRSYWNSTEYGYKYPNTGDN